MMAVKLQCRRVAAGPPPGPRVLLPYLILTLTTRTPTPYLQADCTIVASGLKFAGGHLDATLLPRPPANLSVLLADAPLSRPAAWEQSAEGLAGWSVRVSPDQAQPPAHLQLWCEDCTGGGGRKVSGLLEGAALHPDALSTGECAGAGAPPRDCSTVVLLLRGASLPGTGGGAGAEAMVDTGAAPSAALLDVGAGALRALLQATPQGPQALTVGGQTYSFDNAIDLTSTVGTPFKLFYTLTADGQLRGGLQVGRRAAGRRPGACKWQLPPPHLAGADAPLRTPGRPRRQQVGRAGPRPHDAWGQGGGGGARRQRRWEAPAAGQGGGRRRCHCRTRS